MFSATHHTALSCFTLLNPLLCDFAGHHGESFHSEVKAGGVPFSVALTQGCCRSSNLFLLSHPQRAYADVPKDKWELLPAFLKVKGLVKQHLDSYNYFVNHDIKNILKVNEYVQSDIDPSAYIKYTDIWLRKPARTGGAQVTPMECRLTDSNYSGAIMVKIQYTFEKAVKTFHKPLCIGHLPVMLRSDLCHLKGHGEKELARMGECPLDPGGYFVVKGTEKVILVQEQLSKNRIIVMTDPKKDLVQAEVTS